MNRYRVYYNNGSHTVVSAESFGEAESNAYEESLQIIRVELQSIKFSPPIIK